MEVQKKTCNRQHDRKEKRIGTGPGPREMGKDDQKKLQRQKKATKKRAEGGVKQ